MYCFPSRDDQEDILDLLHNARGWEEVPFQLDTVLPRHTMEEEEDRRIHPGDHVVGDIPRTTEEESEEPDTVHDDEREVVRILLGMDEVVV
jgi:hypothetical protein